MSEPPDSDKSWKVKKKLRLLFLWTIANGWLKRRGRSKEGKNKIRKEVKMKQQQTIVKNQCFEECLYGTWIEICVKKRGFRCFIQPNRKQSGFIFFTLFHSPSSSSTSSPSSSPSCSNTRWKAIQPSIDDEVIRSSRCMTDGGLIAFYTADSHVDLSRTVYRPHRLSVAHGPPAASFTCLCHLTDDEGSSRLSIMVPNKKKKLYLYICIYIYMYLYI